jgi:hypothetical protein
MTSPSLSRPTAWTIVVLGLLAFAFLTIRFSPNWMVFYRGVRDAKLNASTTQQSVAIDYAVLSGYSARGLYVIKQTVDLSTEIDDPNHKITRWRLLVPAVSKLLKLPGWLILALAHIGCLVLIITLVRIGATQSSSSGASPYEAMCFSIVAGASASFFTSMGLLGYYDSWLALALIGVSLAGPRWIVLTACILAPWIDERFVLGLPLALCVRWIRTDYAANSGWQWFKREALAPIIVVACYTIVRLKLGGSGSSQTVGNYLHEFVFTRKLSFPDYIVGALAGLRVGWILVATAIFGLWMAASARKVRLQALILSAGIILTTIIGLFTALDLSRSMVLLFPVLPLGWRYATRSGVWKRFHVAPVLAAIALLLPARHVVGNSIRPVDNMWSPPTPLTHFQNTLAGRYLAGEGVAPDRKEAVKWFRLAADQGLGEAQYNLGVLYAAGDGVAKDPAAAMKWYRLAADQKIAKAQYALGTMYATGKGVARDDAEAIKWYRKAAEQGYAVAQSHLGVKYLEGAGVAKDGAEAARWFRKAAEQNYAPAQSNLAAIYFAGVGVEKNIIRAKAWCQIAADQGMEDAKRNLAMIEKEMTEPEKTQAMTLAREMAAKFVGGGKSRAR